MAGNEEGGAKYYKNPSPSMLEEAMKNEKAGGAIFMESEDKSGKFVVPKEVKVMQFVTDSLTLDFSVADFVFETTTITVKDFLGGVKVKVPPGVRVESKTMNFLSDMSKKLADAHAVADSPRIVIKGVSFMGKVDIKVNDKVPPIVVVE